MLPKSQQWKKGPLCADFVQLDDTVAAALETGYQLEVNNNKSQYSQLARLFIAFKTQCGRSSTETRCCTDDQQLYKMVSFPAI